ncbi:MULTISPECIES: MmcB family DNA repair protein [unclassified Pseudomonas]|uniref:MmcB family DNA repair protein n=1 Tax=unclassified Pseudomonas TaxID=196821 RepID=UPI00132F12E3|nr:MULTISPECIES: MmcB family DNA repair protein [unclassified Pseudomonas]MBM6444192.1 MmcB family DNA repair protein [Pseudomonas sp. MIL9]NJJ58269.1 MmcB family DNA repair protein [Pseudomonas sp. B14(2022)]QHG21752.1 MmcB family DNA repair protein [Pseudomonas sp. DTU12.1]
MGEKEIKTTVLDKLLKTGQIDFSSLVFSEMNLARKARRVDLGYIRNQEMVAIEIKSEKDSLFRLEGQLEEYRKYFDRVIVAVAGKYVEGVLAIADDDVAVWEVTSDGLKVIRKGRLIKNISKQNYLELMTKREVSLLARRIGIIPSDLAMYELKMEVSSRLNKISKSDVKDILLDGISKRFSMPSNRFLAKVCAFGSVRPSDVILLSPYLKRVVEVA